MFFVSAVFLLVLTVGWVWLGMWAEDRFDYGYSLVGEAIFFTVGVLWFIGFVVLVSLTIGLLVGGVINLFH